MKLIPDDFSTSQAERFLNVVRTSIEAGRTFCPQPIDCGMLFIRATRFNGNEGSSSSGNNRDWSPYLTGPLKLRDLPCTHLDLGQPEMGESVARILSHSLAPIIES